MKREEDLKKGKLVELEFIYRLSETDKYTNIERPQWKFPDYDVKARSKDGTASTYELKYDGIYPTSKCVWIEYECHWQPSGVAISKADYFVYKLWDHFYCAKRGKLLELLMASTTKVACQWWDDGTAKLWVIPEEEFYTVAIKLWDD